MPVYATIPGFLPEGTRDPLLNPGSLLYACPAHPEGRWAGDLTTVPPAWSALPNLAHQEAAALIGEGTAETLAPTIGYHGGFTPGAGGQLERTTTGAFHAIMSLTEDVAGQYVAVNLPVLLRDYLRDAEQRPLYMALVGRVTRAGNGGALLQRLSTGSTARMSFSETGGTIQSQPPLGSANLLGKSPNAPIPGLFLMDIATSEVPAGWPAGGEINPAVSFFGPPGSSTLHKTPSWVLYALYIEDLSASGQTYTQAHARMQAFVDQQITAPTGMYYGDAWTDPTTVP